MTFKELNLCGAVIDALAEKGCQSPAAILQQTIPDILSGKDIVASAAGTGKTAAFCTPYYKSFQYYMTHPPASANRCINAVYVLTQNKSKLFIKF